MICNARENLPPKRRWGGGHRPPPHRLPPSARPQKKEGGTPLLCEWIKTVGFLFLGILKRDVVFGLRRGVNAAGQAGNQHVQETLVGLHHVIVGIAHILRSFHGGVLQRDQTEDYAMVPLLNRIIFYIFLIIKLYIQYSL